MKNEREWAEQNAEIKRLRSELRRARKAIREAEKFTDYGRWMEAGMVLEAALKPARRKGKK